MTLTSTVEMENQFEQFDILKLYLNIHISSINDICLKLCLYIYLRPNC